jgi:acetoin utilization deacetylase AcuC-like enzyme
MLFLYDDLFLAHDSGDGHPESPWRLTAIRDHLERTGLLGRLATTALRAATEEDVRLVHSADHLNWVHAASEQSLWLDGDTHAGPCSFDAALLAAGAVLTACDEAAADRHPKSFCLVRPPGHHALPAQAMGFCLLNNAAIGARHLLRRRGVERVAIVDFDVHHGNGTEEVFRKDPAVFCLSLHRWPFYPGTGGPGPEARPAVANRNFPLPADTPAEVFLAKLAEGLAEIEAFRPGAIVVSAGFDAHEDDPLGGLNLRTEDFLRIGRAIAGLADRVAAGRVVSTLEGGYGLADLGPCVEAYLRGLDPSLR